MNYIQSDLNESVFNKSDDNFLEKFFEHNCRKTPLGKAIPKELADELNAHNIYD